MARVKWRGVWLDDRTAKMMDELAAISGKIYINPTQGSYNTSVSASAGTHNGGGAVDLMHPSWSVKDYDTVVRLARKIGFAAWHRTPQQSNWPRHVHMEAVQRGGRNDKGVLSTGAWNQVKAYYDGRNGLANNGKDDGPRTYVGVTWEKYLQAKEPTVSKLFRPRYSGKPKGTLQLKYNTYTNLDVSVDGPPADKKREDRLVYLNVTPKWKITNKEDPDYYRQVAVLRIRFGRADIGKGVDHTSYQSYTITPWEDEFLITKTHWETGQKGRGGKWAMRIRGNVTGASVSTRYAKGSQEK